MGTLTTSRERTFTVEEYYKLAEVGILQPWERVELIDGHITNRTNQRASCHDRRQAESTVGQPKPEPLPCTRPGAHPA
jgi:hypothetical protein